MKKKEDYMEANKHKKPHPAPGGLVGGFVSILVNMAIANVALGFATKGLKKAGLLPRRITKPKVKKTKK